MNLNFYIIYTPTSFAKLSLAIVSLLKFTPYNFTLVANGMALDELTTMQKFVQQHPRLRLIDLPGNVTVPHGTALNHLFGISHAEYFCFMDSDVFAFDDFSEDLEKLIINSDVVSSCKPLEWLIKKSPKGYRGHCTVSPSGKSVAMTYFSVYKRQSVVSIFDQYKITFERYMRSPQIPKKAISLLSDLDKHTFKFNTGKLLNIIQAYHNQNLNYREFKGLVHLGGVSRYSEHTINKTRNIDPSNLVAIDRVATRYYFNNLLENFGKNNYQFPQLSLHNSALEQMVFQTSKDLMDLHKNQGSKL